ncbi:nuclear transport factor 2 family protein [Natrinema versiforme]|uniref:Nuclear transport factor 2 family protein n=1 Tax=Natrinema versiforme TaxID=88724 RepID=A0A4P8WKC0_9EURY|nr:nuclear transport factor 2 family protein [Natrinema versiforme]QCS43725.1 nuclear transport factor 2 family protein [Natrinema versiforme]
MTVNEQRSAEQTTPRERLTEFYTAFNHVVTDRGGTDELASLLTDDITWVDATTGERGERTSSGIESVLENAVRAPGRRADHLQALPERFIDAGDTMIVAGAYVGTVGENSFDIAFAHVFDLRDGRIRRCTAYRDTALERRVFDA